MYFFKWIIKKLFSSQHKDVDTCLNMDFLSAPIDKRIQAWNLARYNDKSLPGWKMKRKD